MRGHHSRSCAAALLVLVACGAVAAARAQMMMPPLQPFEPLQPLQPMQPFRPLPPLRPFPGFPAMPQMQMPGFYGQAAGAGGGFAASSTSVGGVGGGSSSTTTRSGPAGTAYSSSATSSSFGGPMGGAGLPPGCNVVQETSGEAQGSGSDGSSSCRLSQRVELCMSANPKSRGHVRAVASINGQEATCCVALQKISSKTMQMFCAAPSRSTSKAYMRLPAVGTSVDLKPACASSTQPAGAANTGASLACTVTFTQLPEGYMYPEGHTASKPLVMHAGSSAGASAGSSATAGAGSAGPSNPTAGRSGGFVPCGNKQFKRFMQAVSRPLPDGGVMLTSKCE